jgi:transposase InsO family protein
MRYPASEKLEIIRTVEQSSLGVCRTLHQIGIPRSTFYNWYDRYVSEGLDGLEDKKPDPGPVWNKVPEQIAQQLVRFALAEPDLSPRELAVRFTEQRRYYLSESTVYRVLKSHDLITAPAFIVLKAAERFANPTTAVNQLWQTDFTYLKVMAWGWFYLSTVLDDFSRYIIAWRLCQTMSARDVSATLQDALETTGLDRVGVRHRPRLLSDNGPCYVSSELQSWLAENGVPHTRGKPYHPMTQGKIERWHRTLKDRILLNNYYLPEELERQIDAFVRHYNTRRYHESLNNLTPYDVFTGQGIVILQKRQRIKEKTMSLRKRLHLDGRVA